jgi:hypothetical protein
MKLRHPPDPKMLFLAAGTWQNNPLPSRFALLDVSAVQPNLHNMQ